jgi:hypothetical protein
MEGMLGGAEAVSTHASGSKLVVTALESFGACVRTAVPPSYALERGARGAFQIFSLPPILLSMVDSS